MREIADMQRRVNNKKLIRFKPVVQLPEVRGQKETIHQYFTCKPPRAPL